MRSLARWHHVRRGTTQRLPASDSHGATHAARPAAPFAAQLVLHSCNAGRKADTRECKLASTNQDNSCDAVVSFMALLSRNARAKINKYIRNKMSGVV